MKAKSLGAGAGELRRLAEAKLAQDGSGPGEPGADQARLVHELQVHRIELEMQNEALKDSRAELEAALERYADLYDFAPAGYFTLLRDGVIRELNLSGAQLLGAERARLVGRRFGVFVAEASRGEFYRFLEQTFVLNAKHTCDVDLAAEGRGPTPVTIEAGLSPDGQECRAVVMDISERRRAERALEVSESGFRDMLTCTAQAIVMTDATGKILFANNMMKRIFGFVPGELAGRSVDVLLPERLRDIHATHRAEYVTDPSPRTMGLNRNLLGRRKDGTEFPIEVALGPMKTESGPVVVAFINDITPRREAEKEIRGYQERLQRMAFDATLTEERERRRLAVVLHDGIGQHLALAQMSLASVREGVKGVTRKAIDKVVALLVQSISDTRSLVSELSPPLLYELGITEALSWLSEEMSKRHGMRVTLKDDNADKALDDTTAAFAFRAVRELLMNALKHAESLAVNVSLRRTFDHLEILVEDAGVGFDPERLTSVANEGGFGLMSVREQISRLGGTVEITSAKGRGTRAVVRVPLKPAEPALRDGKKRPS